MIEENGWVGYTVYVERSARAGAASAREAERRALWEWIREQFPDAVLTTPERDIQVGHMDGLRTWVTMFTQFEDALAFELAWA